MAMNWQCPFCGSYTTITDATRTNDCAVLNHNSKHGSMALVGQSTACQNPDCLELTLTVYWGKPTRTAYGKIEGVDTSEPYSTHRLLPEAALITLPDGVPEEIAVTYRETVLVSPISGRAAAAMARRCLQGIVRDFFAIPENKRGNLGAELSFVKDQIDPDLWDAIQALRSIGDIGAHMDKNVDQIIDVSPDEAQLLIELIETLFKDWYGVRAKKQRNRSGLMAMLQEKRGQQKAGKQLQKEADPVLQIQGPE